MKIAVLFGGAGYIGRNLVDYLLENGTFDVYYVVDIKRATPQMGIFENERVHFVLGDVRQKISLQLHNMDRDHSWIFNLAAIHREPGHGFYEYFDTNIPGAENIVSFAVECGIKNILFTSSIAPYGRSLGERTEASPLYPETAYGISKALAEKIHENWLSGNPNRRLIVVRPSVIFGPKDPGNVYRMINSLKKGSFVLPNGGNVIKAYGYIYGLVESMLFTMQRKERHIIYNYAENPLVPLKEMVSITKEELGYKKPTLSLSINTLALIAFIIHKAMGLMGRKADIHPVRVRKAGFPTNIRPQYLIDAGFNFKYGYRQALRHWKKISPNDFSS